MAQGSQNIIWLVQVVLPQAVENPADAMEIAVADVIK